MIQTQTKNTINTTNMDITEQFTIETNESMFRMLTSNVYTNIIEAVIREWSTNAIDACKEAQLAPRFDVHLPTSSELYFSVRDYGTGISEENLAHFFVLGRSSKRDSNDYNGTLGIGRMAGLAYSDAFLVDSYHNGSQISYLVTFKDGFPTPIHMGTFPTSEPNGLCIKLDVNPHDIKEFEETAERIYRYFSHKPIMNKQLRIDLPQMIDDSITWFFDKEFTRSSYDNYLVMGNVRYVIPQNNKLNDYGFRHLIIKAPLGSVSFNPGRESLSLDDTTLKFVQTQFDIVVKDYVDKVNVDIRQQPTVLEKIRTFEQAKSNTPYELRNKLSLQNLIPDKFFKLLHFHNEAIINKHPTNLLLKQKYNHGNAARDVQRDYWYIDRDYNFLILDVKTNFTPIYEQLTGEYIVLARRANEDMDLFVASAKTWLAELGVTDYTLASEYKVEKEKTSRIGEGMRICPINTISQAVRQSTKANTTATYWYMPLSGSAIDLPTDEQLAVFAAYNKLPTANKPQLVGIQKKYQKHLSELPLYIPAKEGIQAMLSNQSYVTYDYTAPHLRHRPKTSKLADVDEVYKFLQLKQTPAIRDNYIDQTTLNTIQSQFTVNVTTVPTPTPWEELCTKYPLLSLLSSDYESSEAMLTHYFDLEHHKHG